MDAALNALRDNLNYFMSWADTPGSIAAVLIPAALLFWVLSRILDRQASYWRRGGTSRD